MKNIIESNAFRYISVITMLCLGIVIIIYFGEKILSYIANDTIHVYTKGLNFYGDEAAIISSAWIFVGLLCVFLSRYYYRKWFYFV